MCFSPEASFIAAAFLTVMTIASYRRVMLQKTNVSAKLGLVLVTAGFAVQQFFEGFVWLTLLNNFDNCLKQVAIYGFIFFAFIFWPVYIPICIYRLEQDNFAKNLLKLFIIIGSGTAALLLERITYFGVTAQLANCHIIYNSQLAQFSLLLTWVVMIAYLIATVGAMLVSTFPGMRLMGAVIGVAYLAAYLFYLNFLISVWCFFAAISSLLIYLLVVKNR